MPKSSFFPLQLLRATLCLFILILTACSTQGLPGIVTITPPQSALPPQTSTPQVMPLPSFTFGPPPETPTAGLTATQSPTPQPAPAIPTPHPLYVIEATMDYDARSLQVTQEISYPNTSGESLSEIVLAVEPNLITGVFSLASVSVDGQNINSYTIDGQKLDVTLPDSLAPGKVLELGLAYSLSLPVIEQGDPNVIRPQIFGVADRQVNLVDWYPFIVPYAPGTGWILHKPWFYGEHLVYPLADFDVTLRFSDTSNLPVVAASSAPEAINGGTHYLLQNARDFSFSMGRTFQVLSQQVGDTIVYSYYLGDINKAPAQAVLDATSLALRTYTDLFGPYPHPTLTAIQGDFNDGMEFDGLFFLSNSFYNLYDNTDKNYLVMVAAHETSHQWWFGRVGNDQSQEPWLDESLAMYCEKLFYEKNHPEDLGWWWSVRVDFYQPEGKIDNPVQDYGGFTPYTNATYRMGAHFLEDLRQNMGDEAFFAFMRDYASQMDGKTATAADFFRILRTHTSVDLSGLTAKYFQNPH